MEKWIVLIISVIVLAFICWKEVRRKNKAHLNFRLVASVIAVLALYFIAQPLTIQRKLDPSKENTAVLLTYGFEKDSLNGLKNIPLYTNEPSIAAANKKVTFIPDLEYFSRSQADINKIHVLGSGLDKHELEAFKHHQLIFHPNQTYGFHSVHWNNALRSGERLTVQGSFSSKTSRTVKILLRGLSTTLDSVEVTGTQTFDLGTNPKLIDKAVYSLLALSGRDTLAIEKIPVIIAEKTPIKILMLSSSPNFEHKFLKNWLYSENYELAIRNAISKGKFSTEFLNMDRINLNRISPGLLKNFDILIGDAAELSGLSPAENAAVQNEVSSGMGLVIRTESPGGGGFFNRSFNIRESRAIVQKNLSLNWAGRTAKKVSSPSGFGMEIILRPGEQALVRDDKNHIVVSSKLFGAGRMIASTLSDTYTWVLSNNSTDYSSFWSHILGKAVRKPETSESWSILNGFSVVNSPTTLMMESSAPSLPLARIENTTLHFAQDPSQSYRWTADYWPIKPGWQSIRSSTKESWFYVYDEKDWVNARAAQKSENTARIISESKTTVQKAESALRMYVYTVPAIWFYVLFLVGMGYLWWEGKMGGIG